jgi:hypothetical protein
MMIMSRLTNSLPRCRITCAGLMIQLFTLLMIVEGVTAQDLGNVGKPLDFSVKGGIQVTSNFYSAKGIPNRTSPFAWSISGSPTVQIGEIRLLFSFSFHDQKFGYGTPFNKFGVSPYYKWVKLLLGWRTMNFSPYSFQGKSFLGAGLELTPGKFRFSTFRGTLRNPFAQADTLIYGAYLVDSYTRKAHGMKIGYGSAQSSIDFYYVKVKDDITTITDPPLNADYELDPSDNIVIGTSYKITAFKKLEWAANINLSSFTDNQSLGETIIDDPLLSFVNDLLVVNSSTQVSLAGDMSLGLNLQNVRLGLKYRRVEPQYRALGISYIQSDIQSFIGSASVSVMKRKMLISVKGGIEQTNLRDLDYLGRQRIIQDAQVQYIPSKSWQWIGQWSNYQYETQDGLIELNDTLRLVNVTRQSGLIINHTGQGEVWQTGFSASLHRQAIRDQSPIASLGSDINSTQGQLSIKVNYLPFELRCTPAVFYAQYQFPGRTQERYGLGLQVQKSFMDRKINAGVQFRIARNDVDQLRNGHTTTLRLNGSWQLEKGHSLAASISLMDKASTLSPSYSESRSTLSYAYRF